MSELSPSSAKFSSHPRTLENPDDIEKDWLAEIKRPKQFLPREIDFFDERLLRKQR